MRDARRDLVVWRATVFDFEVLPAVKDSCKDGGWSGYGFSTQDECVSALQADDNAAK